MFSFSVLIMFSAFCIAMNTLQHFHCVFVIIEMPITCLTKCSSWECCYLGEIGRGFCGSVCTVIASSWIFYVRDTNTLFGKLNDLYIFLY